MRLARSLRLKRRLYPALASLGCSSLLALWLTLVVSGQTAFAQDGLFPLNPVFFDAPARQTTSVAWGDMDNDGDLDLAVGNYEQPNQLYRNDHGQLTLAWSAPLVEDTQVVAWGDMDNDGDLDLAVGNSTRFDTDCQCYTQAANHLYRNVNGQLTLDSTWQPAEQDGTYDLAWGDVDQDGDLDLAIGNGRGFHKDCKCPIGGAANHLYLNHNGQLSATPIWSSTEQEATTSIAFAHFDYDGDLDLIVGNAHEIKTALRIYRNDAGNFTPTAISTAPTPENYHVSSLAIGDFKVDGLADFVVTPNLWGQPLYLYVSHDQQIKPTLTWSTTLESNGARSGAVGDVDGKSGLDLVVGRESHPAQLYLNHYDGIAPALWFPQASDQTQSVAWGDMDNDGDLDLAVGNWGQPNRIYRNDSFTLRGDYVLTTTITATAQSLAWGDVDVDGDLDLAVGYKERPLLLYRNMKQQQPVAVWASAEAANTQSMAWGDVDGDGDLDLAVGNAGQPSRLYRNDNGQLTAAAVWATSEHAHTTSVAWGDVDGDGDLDLAVGNQDQPSRLYRNDQGRLTTAAVWATNATAPTTGIAWGDVDDDGDLDLAVSNGGEPSRLYRNRAGLLDLTPVWSTAETTNARAVAWGDVDGDGDLDLAVANDNERNRLYRNDDGRLTTTAVWLSDEATTATALAWADPDGDGDLDLLVSNRNQPLYFYRNQAGRLVTTATTTGAAAPAFAWGDSDADGDLDLAAARALQGDVNLSVNPRNFAALSPHPYGYVSVTRPGVTPNAAFFATPEIMQGPFITIPYTLFATEPTTIAQIVVEFSPNGGGQWFSATSAHGPSQTQALAASPDGVAHHFVWSAESDLIRSDNVVFRISVPVNATHTLIQWGSFAGQSPPFRVAGARQYIKVVDEEGNPVSGAALYRNGQPITITNSSGQVISTTARNGLFNSGPLQVGDQLVATVRRHLAPSARAHHDGWAYQTLLTSLTWADGSYPQAFTVTRAGEQRLTLRRAHPLVLFNLVVAIEWDADDSYLAEIAAAMRNAAAYLFDLTDGQMTFGQVAIYDNGVQWADADLQIAAKNIVHPHAYVGGLVSGDKSQVIRVGRGWDGVTGNQGPWDQPDGFRTLVHEFGHYGLHLYDEYFAYLLGNNGNLLGVIPAYCPQATLDPATDAKNGSAMYDQYHSSEFSARGVAGLWSPACEATAHWQLTGAGESTWETMARLYNDSQTPPRWQLTTPLTQGLQPGPTQWPATLPAWPQITLHNSGIAGPARGLLVVDPQGRPVPQAIVALYKKSTREVIGQGFTDPQGAIRLYGAATGDTVRAAALHGGQDGSLTVQEGLTLTLRLQPVLSANQRTSGHSAVAQPYLALWPESTRDPAQVLLYLTLTDFADAQEVSVTLWPPGAQQALSPPVSYTPGLGIYQATALLNTANVGVGQAQVRGLVNARMVEAQTSYRLQQINPAQAQDLYSDDGNLHLHLAADSIPGDHAHLILMPTSGLPGPLLITHTLVGNVYALTASGAVVALDKPGLLRLRLDRSLFAAETTVAAQIYRWEPNRAQWQALPSASDQDHGWYSAPVTALGVYALLTEAPNPTERLYLPYIAAQK